MPETVPEKPQEDHRSDALSVIAEQLRRLGHDPDPAEAVRSELEDLRTAVADLAERIAQCCHGHCTHLYYGYYPHTWVNACAPVPLTYTVSTGTSITS